MTATVEEQDEELPRKRVELTDELNSLEEDTMEASWREAVGKEFAKPYFTSVSYAFI